MTDSNKTKENVLIVLLAVSLLLSIFNYLQISQLTGFSVGTSNSKVSTLNEIIPTGTPKTYGEELGVSYDDVSPYDQRKADATIDKLAELDLNIQLNEEQNKRYVNILYTLENGISCEYCCGARSIIFDNGDPACGCAHSYAMRGLTKYLITENGNEYTDEEILEEVGKWKALFFPGQITAKADIMKQNGIDVNFISLTSNQYRGIEKGVSSNGGMVGGC